MLANDSELGDRLRAVDDTYTKPVENIKGFSGLIDELKKILGLEAADEILKLIPRPPRREETDTGGKIKYLVGGEVLAGNLVEIIEDESGPRLLIFDPAHSSVRVEDEIEFDGVIYRPYPDNLYPLARAVNKLDEDPMLWSETIDFLKAFFDHPDERVYQVMAAAVAWSYFCQDVKASTPYLCFIGPWRSGKTRALEALAAISYKSYMLVDPSEPSIFRIIEELKPTLIIDEAHVLDSNMRAILASGYRFGARVPRVIDPERKGLEGIKFFDTFSLKIFASREELPDDLLSRTIVIRCEKALRATQKKIDQDKAVNLRTRWLAQKLRLHGKVNVNFDEFESEDGRMQELFSPLIVVAELFGGREAVEAVESFGHEVEREVWGLEISSEEAEVVEVLIRLVNSYRNDAPETVSVSEVLRELGEGWTPHKVGRKLSSLGFRRIRTGGKRGYEINYRLLERLARRYGLSQQLMSEMAKCQFSVSRP